MPEKSHNNNDYISPHHSQISLYPTSIVRICEYHVHALIFGSPFDFLGCYSILYIFQKLTIILLL